jgi:23S rRNA pseudouridine2457 synthase
MARGSKYYILHKPKGYLSQFSKEHGKMALSDLVDLQGDVYPVGRLDEYSEGLLLLTNDKSVNYHLLHPSNKHVRCYLVQVEGQVTKKAIKELEAGVTIAAKGEIYNTLPAKVKKTKKPGNIIDADVSAKVTTWLKIELQEGRYRQVRKMTAKVGFPTLRLVRTHVENLELGNIKSGELLQVNKEFFYSKLNLPL